MWLTTLTELTKLHATTETKHQVQRALLLNVVVSQCATVFQLLAGEDQTLLIRGNAFLVLDLLLHVLNGVVRFHVQRNRLTRQSLDEDLHRTTTETKHQVQRALLLNVVVSQCATVLQLLAGEDQTLLIRGNAFL